MKGTGKAESRSTRRFGTVTLALVALLAGLLSMTVGPASARTTQDGAVAARHGAAATPQPSGSRCSRHNARPFVPIRAVVGPVGGRRVLGVGRVSGLPGTPPLTDAGKVMLAWDRVGIRPGFSHGHVLMNAHAWPDGTALGNALNARLRLDALIKVYGRGDRVQCYRVVRHEVRKPSPRLQRIYYGTDESPARLAIITCAGVRRGPGDWSKRAVWLAKPIR